jgi:hypothetical protein
MVIRLRITRLRCMGCGRLGWVEEKTPALPALFGSPFGLSVPKILALLIPEILARPAIAGRARTLPVLPVGRPAGRGEEDVRNAKTTRSRDLAEGWSP